MISRDPLDGQGTYSVVVMFDANNDTLGALLSVSVDVDSNEYDSANPQP